MPGIPLDQFDREFGGYTGETEPVRQQFGWGDRLGAAVDTAQAGLYGVGEAGGLDMGNARRRNQAEAEYVRRRAVEDTGTPESFRQIRGVGDAARYVGGLAVDTAPQMAAIAAGSMVAGPAGGLAAAYPFNLGDVLQNQREQSGYTDAGKAAGLAIPYTAADAFGVEGAIMRRELARNTMRALDRAPGVRGGLARAGATAARKGVEEGAAETFQEGMNQFGRMAVDPNETFYNAQSADRFAESAVGGFAMGGAFGAGAGGWRRSKQPAYQPVDTGAPVDLTLRDLGAVDYTPMQGAPVPTPQAPEWALADGAGPTLPRGLSRNYIAPGSVDDGGFSLVPKNDDPRGAPLPFAPEIGASEMDLAPPGGLQRDGIPYTADISTRGLSLVPRLDRNQTVDLFSGEATDHFAPGTPELELTPPGSMYESGQRELDLSPQDMGLVTPDMLPANRRGAQGQLAFSEKARTPQGQLFMGQLESLASEGYIDEGTLTQAQTLIAQNKYGKVNSILKDAEKSKAAAAELVQRQREEQMKSAADEERARQADEVFGQAQEVKAKRQTLLQKNGRAPNQGTKKRQEWDALTQQHDELVQQWADLTRKTKGKPNAAAAGTTQQRADDSAASGRVQRSGSDGNAQVLQQRGPVAPAAGAVARGGENAPAVPADGERAAALSPAPAPEGEFKPAEQLNLKARDVVEAVRIKDGFRFAGTIASIGRGKQNATIIINIPGGSAQVNRKGDLLIRPVQEKGAPVAPPAPAPAPAPVAAAPAEETVELDNPDFSMEEPAPDYGTNTTEALVETADTAQDNAQYEGALDELYRRWRDDGDTVAEAFFEENMKVRGFKADFDRTRERAGETAAAKEPASQGARGLKMGGTPGARVELTEEDKATDAILRGGFFKASEGGVKRNRNPDRNNEGETLDVEFTSGAEAAEYLSKNAKNPLIRLLMKRILPHLDGVTTRVWNIGDQMPLGIARHLNGTARAIAGLSKDGKGREIHVRGYDGNTEVTWAHELLHAATMARLLDPALRAKWTLMGRKVSATLAEEAARYNIDPDKAEGYRFFATMFRDADEFLAYSLTSPSFQNLLKTLDAEGKWLQAAPQEKLKDVPQLTLWQKIVDFVRDLFNLPKVYQAQLESIMALNAEITKDNALARAKERRLGDHILGMLDELLAAPAIVNPYARQLAAGTKASSTMAEYNKRFGKAHPWSEVERIEAKVKRLKDEAADQRAIAKRMQEKGKLDSEKIFTEQAQHYDALAAQAEADLALAQKALDEFGLDGKGNMSVKASSDSAPAEPAAKPLIDAFAKVPYADTALGRAVQDGLFNLKKSPAVLKFVTNDQIAEGYKHLKPVQAINRATQRMASVANRFMEVAAQTTKRWRALDNDAQLAMQEAMLKTTMAEMHVSLKRDGKYLSHDEAWMDEANDHLDRKDAKVKQKFSTLYREFQALPAPAKAVYDQVRDNMGELHNETLRAMRRSIANQYADRLKSKLSDAELLALASSDKDVREIVAAYVAESGTAAEKRALEGMYRALRDMQADFGTVKGPYFPLVRFGDHVVVLKGADLRAKEATAEKLKLDLEKALADEPTVADDQAEAFAAKLDELRDQYRETRKEIEEAKGDEKQYVVEFYESPAEAERARRAMAEANPEAFVATAVREDYYRALDGASPAFLRDMMQTLDASLDAGAGVTPAAKAAASQGLRAMYLRRQPERAALRRELRRMSIEGVKSAEMLRGYAQASNTSAWRVSRLLHADEVTDGLAQLSEDRYNADAKNILNELKARFVGDIAVPENNKLLRYAANTTYFMHLGFNLSYFITNATQTWTTSLPILAGRHGLVNSANSLAAASKDVIALLKAATVESVKQDGAVVGLQLRLTDEQISSLAKDEGEAAMLKQLTDDGVIDITIKHDLGAQADGSGGFLAKTMELSSALANYPELYNRLSTALASYRMEMAHAAEGPETAEQAQARATDYAEKIINRTHFNYSPENAPRIMRGQLARLIFQFKRYQQGMIYLYAKLIRDAYHGDADARRSLAYLLGATVATSGVAGLPIAAPIALAAKVLASAYPDDDEPEWLQQWYNGMKDAIGEAPTQALVKGGGALVGLDLSQKLGQGSILNPVAFANTAGKETLSADWWMAASASLMGPASMLVGKSLEAAGAASNGQFGRAAELALPTFMANGVRAWRQSSDGLTTKSGDTLLSPEEFKGWEIGMKAVGFQTVNVSDTYDQRNAYLTMVNNRRDARQALLREYYQAVKAGDSDAVADVRARLDGFNERQPADAIKAKDLAASLKQRTQREQEIRGGLRVGKRDADTYERLSGED